MKKIIYAFICLSGFIFGQHIVIDLSKQKLFLMDKDKIVMSAFVSSGNKIHPTPTGNFRVMEKKRHHRSTLYPIRINGLRGGAKMNYMLRINGSIAIHEGNLRISNNRSIPMSHGCIRVPSKKAKILFQKVSLNTPVKIIGRASYKDSFNEALLDNDTILEEQYRGGSNLNLTIDVLDIEDLEEL